MAISEIIDLKAHKESGSSNDSWIAVGKVRKTVGLQGWLRIGLLTDYPDRFEPGSEIYIQKRFGEPEMAVVEDWRDHYSDTAIEIKIEGADDCDTASAYVNAMIVIPKDEREELDSDTEFYPDELEGMTVLSPEGGAVGEVVKLEADAPCPYILVKTTYDGKATEVMIPFIKKFVGAVDRAKKTVKLVEPISFHVPVE